jgi:DNA polymerase (family X)
VDNAEIARTLDAYAALLDLAGAAHWSVRAYRPAADVIRATPAPVEQLMRSGRARELRGIGRGSSGGCANSSRRDGSPSSSARSSPSS